MNNLKPCPFCGHDAPEFVRWGDRQQSSIVMCGMCGCRLESSDEGEHNGSSWNRRPAETELLALVERAYGGADTTDLGELRTKNPEAWYADAKDAIAKAKGDT